VFLTVTPVDTIVCEGTSANLVAGGATTYAWYPTTGLSCSNCPTPVATPTTTTTYTVAGVKSGCQKELTARVRVNPLPTANLSPPSAVICSGQSVQFQASGGLSYAWSPSSIVNCPTCQTVIALPTADTTITVTVTDVIGCQSSASAQLTVHPNPTITLDPSSEVCFKDSVQLLASGGTLYHWTPVSGLSCINCSNPKASPPVTTAYTVSVTDANGCWDAASTLVTVLPKPTASFTYSHVAGAVDFNNQSSDDLAWQWDFGDGNTSTDEHPQHTYSANGTYQVTLIAINGNCAHTFSRNIVVGGVGVDGTDPMPGFTVSPNPAREVLVIGITTGSSITEIRLCNSLGQCLMSVAVDPTAAGSLQLEVARLASGMYHVQANGAHGRFTRAIAKL